MTKNSFRDKVVSFLIRIIEGKELRHLIKKENTTISSSLSKLQKQRLIQIMDRGIGRLIMPLIRAHTRVDNKKIIFITSRGSFNCNPRAIVEELLKRHEDITIVWVIRKENLAEKENYPKNVKLVVRDSYQFIK